MVSIWGAKRQPRQTRPDRRGGGGRERGDRAERFLARLVDARVLDAVALERAEAALAGPGRRSVPVLLSELGLVHEATLVAQLADETGLSVLSDDDLPSTPVLPETISGDYCGRARILPLSETATDLLVAAVDPFDDDMPRALAHLTGRRIQLRIGALSALERAHRALYSSEEEDGGDDLARLEDVASQAPIVRLAARLVRRAFELRASDIHVEAEEADLRIRYRVDGVLVEAERLGKSVQLALTTRLKIQAGLNIAERRLPQDGRMAAADRGQDIDIRVSTLPTAHGESIVMRILDGSRRIETLSGLGFDPVSVSRIETMTARANGLVLVTGPTGSGKTTTLYATLSRLAGPHLKVVTVEDPVEYRMAGINQVQAQPGIGLDFAAALRSILRQDPDVVMVGEIRDGETARIAVQAALTGHLVVSTLHTNSAAATVTRLIDMGVEPFLIAATLNGVVAQRLVRRLCRECSAPEPATAGERILLGLAADEPAPLARARGCPACNGTGYRGRRVVCEVMPTDAALRNLIADGASEARIEEAARRAGTASLSASAREAVLAGETTIEEIGRVLEIGA